ncbi:MAG: ribose 5-phosphate isomerase B [Rickettsiales bacterium]|jgi:ribose 5-phosphate isomerase B|nr:ribose 5-phosphate isomerase B [Rickettsiales bacterium]
MKKIVIACDRAGIDMKKFLVEHLKDTYDFVDLGTKNTEESDYPDYAGLVARAINNKEGDFGVLICGTGIGMSMAANKFKGIRAGLCHNTLEVRLTREHNNANILCLGSRIIANEMALENVKVFCETEFSGEERHQRRINKIENI